MPGATTYGCLRDGIHAMFAAHLCASARVDSRDPMLDSVLIGARPGLPPRRADLPGNQPCEAIGGAVPCPAGSAGASRVRELIAAVTSAPLAAQPFAVQQVGAGQVHPQAGAAQTVDRLAVEVLGGCAVADQRSRAGLGAKRPVGPAGAGDAGEPLQGVGGAL